MGGKSSKRGGETPKSLEQTRKGRHASGGPRPNDRRNNSFVEHRKAPKSTPTTPAWVNNSSPEYQSFTHSVKEQRIIKETNKNLDTSWGKTSFNTFDLHNYHITSSQSRNELQNEENYDKFSNFRNITNKRDAKQKERQNADEEAARNKPRSNLTNARRPVLKHESPQKSTRRNSLPLDAKKPNVNKTKAHVSKSSPQKKRQLSVQEKKSAVVERRTSDVSTLTLTDNTAVQPSSNATFKPVRQQVSNYSGYGGNKSSAAAVAVYGNNFNRSPTKRVHGEQPSIRKITTLLL